MMRRILVACLIVLVIALAGCSQSAAEVQMGGTPIPAPEEGRATATGRALWKDGSPHSFTLMRLAEVVRQNGEGIFILDQAFSPGSRTDENGYFVFQNIPAGEYVLVVGDVMSSYYKIVPLEDGTAKVFNIPAGQVTDLGTVSVDFTP
jgi:hypothetical protein